MKQKKKGDSSAQGFVGSLPWGEIPNGEREKGGKASTYRKSRFCRGTFEKKDRPSLKIKKRGKGQAPNSSEARMMGGEGRKGRRHAVRCIKTTLLQMERGPAPGT